jgi:hypothetical protein
MADSKHIKSSPQAQTANPQRALPDGTSGIISFGPYRLLATLRRLERAGRPVPLGDRELVRLHIKVLRKALSQDGMENQYIRTVASRGYIFTAPICRSTAGGGESNCPLWEGHIIDATFPPV